MVSRGVEFQFPHYEVDFLISQGKAVAMVGERVHDSGVVERLYEFLLFMSKNDPYGLVEICRSKTWEVLQGRFEQWAALHSQ